MPPSIATCLVALSWVHHGIDASLHVIPVTDEGIDNGVKPLTEHAPLIIERHGCVDGEHQIKLLRICALAGFADVGRAIAARTVLSCIAKTIAITRLALRCSFPLFHAFIDEGAGERG